MTTETIGTARCLLINEQDHVRRADCEARYDFDGQGFSRNEYLVLLGETIDALTEEVIRRT